MTINDRIRAVIEGLGMNNRSFAQSIGVDPAVMHNISAEKGRKSKPSYDVIEKIMLSYDNINPDFLFKGKGDVFISESGGSLIKESRGSLRGSPLPEQENEKYIKQAEPGSWEDEVAERRRKGHLHSHEILWDKPPEAAEEERAPYSKENADITADFIHTHTRVVNKLLDRIDELEGKIKELRTEAEKKPH